MAAMDGIGIPVDAPSPRAGASSSSAPLLDTRQFGKPQAFSGKEEDWKDFQFQMTAWCSMLHAGMGNRLFTAAWATTALSADHILTLEHMQESNELFFMLALLCKSAALTIVMQTRRARATRRGGGSRC
eukprot:14432388-Alexandrium_andersonii.AAC.1